MVVKSPAMSQSGRLGAALATALTGERAPIIIPWQHCHDSAQEESGREPDTTRRG